MRLQGIYHCNYHTRQRVGQETWCTKQIQQVGVPVLNAITALSELRVSSFKARKTPIHLFCSPGHRDATSSKACRQMGYGLCGCRGEVVRGDDGRPSSFSIHRIGNEEHTLRQLIGARDVATSSNQTINILSKHEVKVSELMSRN